MLLVSESRTGKHFAARPERTALDRAQQVREKAESWHQPAGQALSSTRFHVPFTNCGDRDDRCSLNVLKSAKWRSQLLAGSRARRRRPDVRTTKAVYMVSAAEAARRARSRATAWTPSPTTVIAPSPTTWATPSRPFVPVLAPATLPVPVAIAAVSRAVVHVPRRWRKVAAIPRRPQRGPLHIACARAHGFAVSVWPNLGRGPAAAVGPTATAMPVAHDGLVIEVSSATAWASSARATAAASTTAHHVIVPANQLLRHLDDDALRSIHAARVCAGEDQLHCAFNVALLRRKTLRAFERLDRGAHASVLHALDVAPLLSDKSVCSLELWPKRKVHHDFAHKVAAARAARDVVH
mmetsp:Transcript_25315/g.80512  ORF Transcript_25315/g.80512 Transcript_25315/m.80512 type:complete len:352 (-) Transcript_25315:2016-3071(-)